jgi:serine/threonine protein kinase
MPKEQPEKITDAKETPQKKELISRPPLPSLPPPPSKLSPPPALPTNNKPPIALARPTPDLPKAQNKMPEAGLPKNPELKKVPTAQSPSSGLAKAKTSSQGLPKPGSNGLMKARFPSDSRDGLLRDVNTGDQYDRDFVLEPGAYIGDYVVEDALASGAMGEVWRGKHPVIGKRVAIKVLGKDILVGREAVSRFVQEARAVNEIRHRNIVDIFASGELPDGRPYLVMELLEGLPLSTYIKENGPLPFSLLVDLSGQLCRALSAAHDNGIVHRDLKSDNIFLVLEKKEPPFVKLLDFGIAKLRGDQNVQKDLTRPGAVYGTPQYMSPEQCQAAGEVDHCTDIYSLGIVLFEMITGRVPFQLNSEGLGMLMVNHMMTVPPAPSSLVEGRVVPPEIDALIAQLLAKKKHERPQSCEEVHKALVKAVGALRQEEAVKARPLADTEKASSNIFNFIAPAVPAPEPAKANSTAPSETATSHNATNNPSQASSGSAPNQAFTDSELSGPTLISPPTSAPEKPAPIAPSAPPVVAEWALSPLTPVAPKKRRGWLAAIPALLGALAYFLMPLAKQPPPTPTPATQQLVLLPASVPVPTPVSIPVSAPSHPEKVHLTVSTPKGAQVLLGTEVWGLTPLEIDIPYGEQELELTLQKTGYEPLALRFTPKEAYTAPPQKLKALPGTKLPTDKTKITFDPFAPKKTP